MHRCGRVVRERVRWLRNGGVLSRQIGSADSNARRRDGTTDSGSGGWDGGVPGLAAAQRRLLSPEATPFGPSGRTTAHTQDERSRSPPHQRHLKVGGSWSSPSAFSALALGPPPFLGGGTATARVTRRAFSESAAGAAVETGVSTGLVEQAAANSGVAVATVQQVLGGLHVATGLPWWATIAVFTVGVRVCLTMPAYTVQQRTVARYEELMPHLRQFRAALKYKHQELAKRGKYGAAEATAKLTADLSEINTQVLKENNLYPLWARMQLPLLLQIPVWITLSFALRGLVSPDTAPVELILEFATGGALWFNNLAVPDVWYGLPLITAVANLANLEVNGLRATRGQVSGSPSAPAQQQQQQQGPETPGEGRSGLTWSDPVDNKVMRDHALRGFFRLLSISMVWIGTQLPAGVCFYWCVSACYGVVQNLAFLFPSVRRAAAIPRTSSEVDRPMADLAAKAHKEWATFFSDLKRYN